MNTNDESYGCDLEFAFEQTLASRSAKREWLEVIAGTPLCKQDFALREVTAGMGLKVRVSCTLVDKRWQKSTIILIPQ